MLDLDYDSSAELWNILSLVGHGLMALAVLASAGCCSSRSPAPARPLTPTRTVATRSSGPPPRRRRPTTTSYVPTVASASPLFDLTYEGTVAVSDGEAPATRAAGGRRTRRPAAGARRHRRRLPGRLDADRRHAGDLGAAAPAGRRRRWPLPGRLHHHRGRLERDVDDDVRAVPVRPMGGVLRQAWRPRSHRVGARGGGHHGDRLHQRPGVRLDTNGGADQGELLRGAVLRHDRDDAGAGRRRPGVHGGGRLPDAWWPPAARPRSSRPDACTGTWVAAAYAAVWFVVYVTK